MVRLGVHLLVALFFSFAAAAETTDNLSLEDLLNINVEIAGKRMQSQQQASSIVSVITRNDIDTYGFRDLADILNTVPGFQLGLDALNIYGSSVRGIWGHEGKILIMINGVQVQDYGFGLDNQIGSYPTQMMEKVEIIRGPGSALYGGFAEVGVINIYTRQMPKADTNFIGTLEGAMMGKNWTKGAFADASTKAGNVQLGAHLGYTSTPTAARNYEDFAGTQLKFGNGNTPRTWRHAIVTAETKKWDLQYTSTSFSYYGQDGYTTIVPPLNGFNMEKMNQTMQTLTAKYHQPLGEQWKLEPKFEYTTGNDNNTFDYPAAVTGFGADTSATLTRWLGEMGVKYDPTENDHVLLGVGYIKDGVENVLANGDPGLQTGPSTSELGFYVAKESRYAYGQYNKQWDSFGGVVGARYENTAFGDAFAPRLGLTYVMGKFNTKLLYGKAYRVPMPWQVYSRFLTFPTQKLKPETADSFELEVGYKFASNLSARVNGYIVKVKDPLVYSSTTLGYTNLSKIESHGVEGELNWKNPTYGGTFNFSYNKPDASTDQGFLTDGKNDFLGMAEYKLNLLAYYKINNYSFAPSLMYLPARQGQAGPGVMSTKSYPAFAIANFAVTGTNICHDTDVTFSVHNIFDQEYKLIQAYYGDHAPVPVMDRQFTLDVVFKM